MKESGGCDKIFELFFLMASELQILGSRPLFLEFLDEFLVTVGSNKNLALGRDFFLSLEETSFKGAEEVPLCVDGIPALLANIGGKSLAGDHACEFLKSRDGLGAAGGSNIALANSFGESVLGLLSSFHAEIQNCLKAESFLFHPTI